MMKEIIHMKDGGTLVALSDSFAVTTAEELNKAVLHEERFIKIGNQHTMIVPVSAIYYIEAIKEETEGGDA